MNQHLLNLILAEPAKTIEPGTWDGWFVAILGLLIAAVGAIIWLVAFGQRKGAKEQRSEDLASILKAQTDAAASTLKAQTDAAAVSIKAQTDSAAAALRSEIELLRGQLTSVTAQGSEHSRDCKTCRSEIDKSVALVASKVEHLSESNARSEERVKTLFDGMTRVETKVGVIEGKIDVLLTKLSEGR